MFSDLENKMWKIELLRTSGACPEQYSLSIDGKPAGYFRLRHGQLKRQSENAALAKVKHRYQDLCKNCDREIEASVEYMEVPRSNEYSEPTGETVQSSRPWEHVGPVTECKNPEPRLAGLSESTRERILNNFGTYIHKSLGD
jgi:hypothetical protein